MHLLKGIAGSPGVGIGAAFVYGAPRVEIPRGAVGAAQVDVEIAAFRAARERSRAALEELAARVRAAKGEKMAGVFEGYLEILMDDELEGQILALIRDFRLPALAAVRDAIERERAQFLSLEDESLRGRARDIEDLGRRLMCELAGVELALARIPEGAILVARDLSPSDIAELDPLRAQGIATEIGGRASHAAIMARALELPAVVGCAGLRALARDGMSMAVDGSSGEVALEPDEAAAAALSARRARHIADRKAMLELSALPAVTRDGVRVRLAVSIGTPADAQAALLWSPDAVGLFRTEFLFMSRPDLPSEEEQERAYAAVARTMKGKKVIVRTLDIGGDKPIAAIRFPEEQNPLLGWRGVRVGLGAGEGYRSILRTQLRAILTAAAEGPLGVLFPMIAAVEEVEALKGILDEVRLGLEAEGRRPGKVEVGIMVETPGAALIADKLAALVDFFSVGSNDLTQYTLAADRGNERVAHCYQPFHPGVWRLFASIVDAARARGIPVGLCGELAGTEEAALPLLGLGLDELSMSAASLPRIKRIVRAASTQEARAVAREVLEARTAAEAQAAAAAACAAVLRRA
jgi:phosphotransferase system enzyme I (PtsI)